MRAFARAPVRVDPAGGGTDAPPFCVDHGGKVVNFGVKRHVFARAQRLDPGAGVLIYSRDLRAGVRVRSSESLPAGGRLELLQGFVKKLLPPGESLLLVTSSEVPPCSGLGGSGAVGVAVGVGVSVAVPAVFRLRIAHGTRCSRPVDRLWRTDTRQRWRSPSRA